LQFIIDSKTGKSSPREGRKKKRQILSLQ